MNSEFQRTVNYKDNYNYLEDCILFKNRQLLPHFKVDISNFILIKIDISDFISTVNWLFKQFYFFKYQIEK